MSTLLLLLVTLTALQLNVAAAAGSSFEGSYTRVSVAPSDCVIPTSCEYKCSVAYKISVTGTAMTIHPTTKPSACTCETLTAITNGNSATGSGVDSSYSLALTSSGVNVITTLRGRTCLGIFVENGADTSSAAAVISSALFSSAGLVIAAVVMLTL